MPAAGGAVGADHEGQVRAWRPHVVARQHADRVRRERAGSPRQPPSRRRDDRRRTRRTRRSTTITSGRGTNIAPQWSPDGTRLVYQHTDPQNSADLFVDRRHRRAKPVRLSDSMPAAIDRSALVEPELVHYPGPDGQQVPAWLFVPKNLDRTKKHPAIVWIHGDGVNQNYDGWHVQRNYAVYYSFHQYLLQQGYVVIAPDYRGSIGYGTAWREGVYMDVGGKDAKDAWMAANYLKTLPYVDMRSRRRLGPELRRLLHADRRHRSADAVPRRGRRRRRRRLRDVLRGSRITAAGRRAASARRSRTRRSTRRRRRCRTSIGSSGRCWCCTARRTSTCRTCIRCG